MKRRLALLLTLPLLASCSVGDVASALGPRPNSQVAELADRAASDAAALDGAAAELRARHAAELAAEITRLCGTHADGTVPESCAFQTEVTELPEADVDDSLLLSLDTAVPEESRALVIRQAVDLAELEERDLPADAQVSDSRDIDAARDLLRREYAAAWGLGLARAYLSPARGAEIDEFLDAHDERILALREVLAPHGEVPVAEAGYELAGGTAPADEALVASLQEELRQVWLNAAVQAHDTPWREFAVYGTASIN
ncbi:DUF4439 domain-containing protein [Corynebacterium hylobatis]|uniref:DUF4439 domain-containing protein n=1 Tax=Corynebacterium hylobatis TaxID=1859290 RepID=UPI0013E030B0|nr:DUF4439 domain-containing protein [Corynebacterium hylobatis]